jgi:hypothetical protein
MGAYAPEGKICFRCYSLGAWQHSERVAARQVHGSAAKTHTHMATHALATTVVILHQKVSRSVCCGAPARMYTYEYARTVYVHAYAYVVLLSGSELGFFIPTHSKQ